MNEEAAKILAQLEHYLNVFIREQSATDLQSLSTAAIMQGLTADLASKTLIWLGNETYVPNRLIVNITALAQSEQEDWQQIFSGPEFVRLINAYIVANGYKIFAPVEVEVHHGSDLTEEGKPVAIDCHWEWHKGV